MYDFIVWYVPGWMRTEVPQEGVMPAMSNAFPMANVLAAHKGWKLEQHKLTTHCRILTPDRKCVAWGGKGEVTAAFEKVKLQVK